MAPIDPLKPVRLRCEYLEDPLGIDALQPRLSWGLAGGGPGARQKAYRITVASDRERLSAGDADLWDTGRVDSDETVHIRYDGTPLHSAQRCWWRVDLWANDDRPGAPSDPAWWETGLMRPSEWIARWLTADSPTPLLRRRFRLERPIRSARLYICGLGAYECFINGKQIGHPPMAPLLSYYPRCVYYDAIDVTHLLRPGENVAGVWLAPAWFGDPEMAADMGTGSAAWRRDGASSPAPPEIRTALLAQLLVHSTDGTSCVLATDEHWRTSHSGLRPVASYRHYCFGFGGEVFDAARQPHGWTHPDYDDAAWRPSRVIAPLSVSVRARPMQPNAVLERVEPVRSAELPVLGPDGVRAASCDAAVRNWGTSATVPFLRERLESTVRQAADLPEVPLRRAVELDFGRHVSGWVEVEVSGAAGDWVSLFGLDWYRLRGEPGETVRLHFMHRAFRYVTLFLYGASGAPVVESVSAAAVQNAIPVSGRFVCSDPELNRIHDAAFRTWSSLLLGGMPMDSWQERFGTALPQNFEPAVLWLESGAFYTKWLRDLLDARRPDGYISTSGGPVAMDYWSSPAGQCTPVMVPWLMWRYYADQDVIRWMYPAMRDWLAFAAPPEHELDATWKPPADHGQAEVCVGDHGRFTARWYDDRGGDLIDTLFIIRLHQIAAELAGVIGEDVDVQRYQAIIERLTRKVNRPEFLNASTGLYLDGDQGCHAVALACDVVPAESRHAASDALFHDILTTRSGHLNTGFYGTSFLFEVLDKLDRPDIAHRIITAPDAPSWASMLRHPATPEPLTVLPEFFTGGMIPHPGWCSVGKWFYQSLGGIHPDPSAPGFRRVLIRPRIPPGLAWVQVEYDSIRGRICVHWSQVDGVVDLTVTVPPNVTALVEVPGSPVGAASTARDGCPEYADSGSCSYEVGAGRHSWRLDLLSRGDER